MSSSIADEKVISPESSSLPYRMEGSYLNVLSALHRFLNPKTYFEIGTANGNTLRLANCHSVAIDPGFIISTDVIGKKPTCHLYQMTSDTFFESHDPTAILGRKIDLAFLDGMHLYEFLLRDFINTERYCKPNSVVVLHDCIPIDDVMTNRSQHASRDASLYPSYWTGDVWKVVPILSELRPDLKIYSVNAAPTGLIIITGLMPESRTLSERYQEIISQYRNVTLTEFGFDKFYGSLRPISISEFSNLEDISKYFFV